MHKYDQINGMHAEKTANAGTYLSVAICNIWW